MNYVIKSVTIPATFGRKPAVFSVVAPVIAIGLYTAITIISMPKSWFIPVLAGTAMVLAWAGLLSAVVGLIQGLRGRGINVVLFALAGLLLNGGILSPVFGVELPIVWGVAGRSNPVALVQLNSLPQVFENSETVIDSRFGFRLELPAGFVKNPNPAASSRTIQSYVRGPKNGSPNISVNIDRLREILPPRKDKPSVDEIEKFKTEIRKSSPYAVLTKIEQEHWKSHTLDVFLVEMPENGDMINSWCVNVPLAGEAVTIKVSGLKGAEDQYRKLLTYILKSLHGDSNWD
jgi:hypothetical protein